MLPELPLPSLRWEGATALEGNALQPRATSHMPFGDSDVGHEASGAHLSPPPQQSALFERCPIVRIVLYYFLV